ncbi:tenascin-r [Plakobranchus ocellatus]|uniref:Tenascin-r n=1 Tax=Plakobranchus ocellatus TaxID=259542 RepID=A0AAV3ZH51_9GAST|nr:tenascin-r [Plakobranchus ocellatus]
MEKLLVLLCLTCFIHGIITLKFSLDHNLSPSIMIRQGCGVLTCKESNSNLIESTITRMSVFKNTESGSISSDKPEQSNLIASVSLREPLITLESNGVKIDGRLEAGQASLRLELVTREDCSAEYTCEVRMLDSQERESINTYHLLQHHDCSLNHGDTCLATPAGSLHLFLLLQQLDAKLAMTGSSIERKVGSVENRLEDKILSLYDNIESKIEKRIIDKLREMDNTLSTIDVARNTKLEGQEDLEKSLATLKTEQQETLKGILASVKRFDDGLNSTNSKLSSVYSLLRERLAWQQTDQIDCKNLTQVVQQVINSKDDLQNNINEYILQVHEGLQGNFQQLNSDMNNVHTGIDYSIYNAFSQVNETLIDFLTSMNDFFTPKVCRKGVIYGLSDASFPYTVIRPNTETIFNFPYLCDMITDGGGWIVIQRRTTGNVDFYRDWASYKKGFGSLDDDFWLGNDNIHTITNSGAYELRVDLKYQGMSAFAHYSSFSIDAEVKNYVLNLGKYAGTAGESLNHHRGVPFSTFDRDNDSRTSNCAVLYSGAWWYNSCHNANLNGKWMANKDKGPRWRTFSGHNPVSYSEMKIRML